MEWLFHSLPHYHLENLETEHIFIQLCKKGLIPALAGDVDVRGLKLMEHGQEKNRVCNSGS